ncbi:MAG: RNA polymerase sigma factor [Gemmatimonadaceae bacterium]|nr:RNA polymerase sigma factor [Gemmatimonadaceae bacterium]
MIDTDNDADLVARARRGDDDAFRRLVERHQAAVARTVFGMLGAGDDADDAGQETFVRFHQALDSFRGDSSVRTYLVRIAMSVSLNALRSRTRRETRFVSDDTAIEHAVDETTGAAMPDGDTAERIRLALDALSEEHRAVVVLRLLEERSTRETAEILEVPEGTVLSRLSRAVRQLRVTLGPVWEEFTE